MNNTDKPLRVKNERGELFEIPERYRIEVQDMIREGRFTCLNNLIGLLRESGQVKPMQS